MPLEQPQCNVGQEVGDDDRRPQEFPNVDVNYALHKVSLKALRKRAGVSR